MAPSDCAFSTRESFEVICPAFVVSGETDEALRAYHRLVEEFPDSEYVREVRTRIDELS